MRDGYLNNIFILVVAHAARASLPIILSTAGFGHSGDTIVETASFYQRPFGSQSGFISVMESIFFLIFFFFNISLNVAQSYRSILI